MELKECQYGVLVEAQEAHAVRYNGKWHYVKYGHIVGLVRNATAETIVLVKWENPHTFEMCDLNLIDSIHPYNIKRL